MSYRDLNGWYKQKNLEMNNWALESYTLQAPPGGMGGWHVMRCQEAMLWVNRRHGTPLYHMQGGKVHKAFVAVPIAEEALEIHPLDRTQIPLRLEFVCFLVE